MRTFAELLTNFIRQAGITDSELARSIGISRQTIFRWREGLTERPNKREDVTAIADKLRLTPEERNELLLAGGFRPEGISEPTETSTGITAEIDEQPDQPVNENVYSFVQDTDTTDQASDKKPFLRLPRRWVIFIAGAVILIPLIIWLLLLNGTDDNTTINQSTSNQTATSLVPGTLSPANSGEILILVSPFCTSGDYTGLAEKVVTAIDRESTGNRIVKLRAEILTETIGNLKEAEEVRKDNNASLVLFGECYSDSIELRIIPATGQSYPVMEINGDQTVSVNVVSMIALAKACIDTQQEETAFSLLSRARNTLTDNSVSNESLFSMINALLDETGIRSSNT